MINISDSGRCTQFLKNKNSLLRIAFK